MRIKFITEEGLLAAKANYAVIYKEILKKKATDLPTLFNDSGIIRDSSIEIEEFSFDMSQDKPVATDVENIRRVYNHMKGLSESQASDERIWVAFTLHQGLDYMSIVGCPIMRMTNLIVTFSANLNTDTAKGLCSEMELHACGGSATIHTILKEQILMS